MIETKDDVKLFEWLEREFAGEHELVLDMQRDLQEVKRLVSSERTRPGALRRIAPALVAAIFFAAIGFGAGMLVQYQQTQEARDQLARIGSVVISSPYAEYVDTAVREGGMYFVNTIDEKALVRSWPGDGTAAVATDERGARGDPTPGQAPGR